MSTGSYIPSIIKSRKVLKLISIGRLDLLISADIASLRFGSKFYIYSSTFSIDASLVAHVFDRKQVVIRRPKSSIKCSAFFNYSSFNGSEWGRTITPWLTLTPGAALGSDGIPDPPI